MLSRELLSGAHIYLAGTTPLWVLSCRDAMFHICRSSALPEVSTPRCPPLPVTWFVTQLTLMSFPAGVFSGSAQLGPLSLASVLPRSGSEMGPQFPVILVRSSSYLMVKSFWAFCPELLLVQPLPWDQSTWPGLLTQDGGDTQNPPPQQCGDSGG